MLKRAASMSDQKSDIDFQEVAAWFGTLYRGSRGYLHIASTGNWVGQFFDIRNGYAAAAQYVERLGRTSTPGIYARVTTLTTPPAEGKRGGASLSASLPALWADIDIAGPNHKHVACRGGDECNHMNELGHRKHSRPVLPLPPDEDAARQIVDVSGLPVPTLWVHSGGGLYPIWLIEPVHQFNGDHAKIDKLSVEWQRAIEVSAASQGWHYGTGIGDLARVLRVAGTWNRKTSEVQPCQVIEHLGQGYTTADLRAAIDQMEWPSLPKLDPVPQRPPSTRPAGDIRPGDDFIARVDWSDPLLLGKLGWRVLRQQGGYREWLRDDPSVSSTLSATTGRDGLDNLYVFSTSTPFPTNIAISKLEAFRILHGYATHTEAVKALNRRGFGTPPVPVYANLEPLEWEAWDTVTPQLVASPNGSHGADRAIPDDWGAEGPALDRSLARRIVLTPASSIKPRRVRWGWKDGEYGRCPVGEMTLIPGREGVGKSLFLAWLIANITRGTLPGEFYGKPRPVLYSTAEDSWEHTVAPRLIAAQADMKLIYRVEVEIEEIGRSKLVLPRDCRGLAEAARGMEAAAVAMDPIISLIDDELSVNQSRQLRLALEPLRDAAERAGVMVVALAHFNKTADADVLTKIPGARAWVEVARAAIALAEDKEEGTYVASQVKNNLGRKDLPHLTYQIERVWIDTDEGPATADTGKLVWTGTSPTGVDEILERRPTRTKPESVNEVVQFVVDRYEETGRPATKAEVVSALPQMSAAAIQKALSRAVERGHLERTSHNFYKPAESPE